jgi:hypothetical protein
LRNYDDFYAAAKSSVRINIVHAFCSDRVITKAYYRSKKKKVKKDKKERKKAREGQE